MASIGAAFSTAANDSRGVAVSMKNGVASYRHPVISLSRRISLKMLPGLRAALIAESRWQCEVSWHSCGESWRHQRQPAQKRAWYRC